VETIIQQTVIVGIGAIGMTFVIISGGIDLSVGSTIAMGSVAVAFLMETFAVDPLPAAIGGILVGLLWGLLNGVLIARFKMVPFIVTLGTLLVVRGVAKGLAQSMPINTGYTWLSELLAALPPDKKWQLMPPGAWLMILLAVIMAGVLKYLPIGRHVFAVGSSEETARLCGVAVEKVKIFVYTLCGGLAGLGGLMLMSYQEQGDPTAAIGLELDVIAAVVIGGGSLSGGEGSILGSIVGAIIMTVIRTGCQLNGWPTWVTQVVTGAVIVIAVAVDRLRHRK
jgi:ribose transport system permease protein